MKGIEKAIGVMMGDHIVVSGVEDQDGSLGMLLFSCRPSLAGLDSRSMDRGLTDNAAVELNGYSRNDWI